MTYFLSIATRIKHDVVLRQRFENALSLRMADPLYPVVIPLNKKLFEIQEQLLEPVIKFMKDEFDLTYTKEKVASLQGIDNLKKWIQKLNSYALTSLFFSAWFSNSLPIGLSLIHEKITIEDSMWFDYIDFLDFKNP